MSEGFVGCISRVEFDEIIPLKLLFQEDPLSNIQVPIFRTFFPGKIPRKIPQKIFPPKMSVKIIPQNFPLKITFRGKKCTKNWPQVSRISFSGETPSELFCP
jgi:hypothetical protein